MKYLFLLLLLSGCATNRPTTDYMDKFIMNKKSTLIYTMGPAFREYRIDKDTIGMVYLWDWQKFIYRQTCEIHFYVVDEVIISYKSSGICS